MGINGAVTEPVRFWQRRITSQVVTMNDLQNSAPNGALGDFCVAMP
jgi:hypothetical protein